MTVAKLVIKGHVILYDDADAHLVDPYQWNVTQGKTLYARRSTREPRKGVVLMHRAIMGLEPGNKMRVDHINHDGLDNRRSNLRLATASQNAANGMMSMGGSSRYKGVFWAKNMGRWGAKIKVNQRDIVLGYFDDEDEAARTYDNAARKAFGSYAQTNL